MRGTRILVLPLYSSLPKVVWGGGVVVRMGFRWLFVAWTPAPFVVCKESTPLNPDYRLAICATDHRMDTKDIWSLSLDKLEAYALCCHTYAYSLPFC